MSKKKRGPGGPQPNSGRKTLAHPEGRTKFCGYSVPAALDAKLQQWAVSKGLNKSQAATEAIRRLVRGIKD